MVFEACLSRALGSVGCPPVWSVVLGGPTTWAANSRNSWRPGRAYPLWPLAYFTMNDWRKPVGGKGGGGNRSYMGPNGSAEKVDYSRLPISEGSDGEGEDWIQRQIKGHKVGWCGTCMRQWGLCFPCGSLGQKKVTHNSQPLYPQVLPRVPARYCCCVAPTRYDVIWDKLHYLELVKDTFCGSLTYEYVPGTDYSYMKAPVKSKAFHRVFAFLPSRKVLGRTPLPFWVCP